MPILARVALRLAAALLLLGGVTAVASASEEHCAGGPPVARAVEPAAPAPVATAAAASRIDAQAPCPDCHGPECPATMRHCAAGATSLPAVVGIRLVPIESARLESPRPVAPPATRRDAPPVPPPQSLLQ